MPTILITGTSSGFGLETARHFLAQGWRVVATMRQPRADLLPPSEQLTVLPLDVTDAASIRQAVAAAGPIDVLVNNAGIGAVGPAEVLPMAVAQDIFATNVLGAIAMTQAVLPQFRQRHAGVIINVSSAVTLATFPWLAAYSASKAALNRYTECMAQEVAPFGIRAHLVLPGAAPATRFGENVQAAARVHGVDHPDYGASIRQLLAHFEQWAAGPHTESDDVVEAVWRAATDPQAPLHIPAGEDAVAMAAAA